MTDDEERKLEQLLMVRKPSRTFDPIGLYAAGIVAVLLLLVLIWALVQLVPQARN